MKAALEDLAIFGGSPAFAELLHVGRPNIGDRGRLLERIHDLLDRRWLTNNGPYVLEFERQLCQLTGAPHCIVTCNGTVALEIAIRAAGMSQEVIVPAFTFVATAHALQWQGITPVFCDVDPSTHNLDPESVERSITPRTTGILGVHLWGRACRVDELAEIARRHGLKLLFDAAHALGCTHRGRMVGGFGDAEVFSFHATKFVNSFEGGAIVTADDGAGGSGAHDAQLRLRGLRRRPLHRDQRQDARSGRGDGAHVAGEHRRVHRGEPSQLSPLPEAVDRSPGTLTAPV